MPSEYPAIRASIARCVVNACADGAANRLNGHIPRITITNAGIAVLRWKPVTPQKRAMPTLEESLTIVTTPGRLQPVAWIGVQWRLLTHSGHSGLATSRDVTSTGL